MSSDPSPLLNRVYKSRSVRGESVCPPRCPRVRVGGNHWEWCRGSILRSRARSLLFDGEASTPCTDPSVGPGGLPFGPKETRCHDRHPVLCPLLLESSVGLQVPRLSRPPSGPSDALGFPAPTPTSSHPKGPRPLYLVRPGPGP